MLQPVRCEVSGTGISGIDDVAGSLASQIWQETVS